MDSKVVTETEKEQAIEKTEVSKEAIEAVEAMKAALSEQEAEDTVYLTPGMGWRKALRDLEEEVEKEFEKANNIISDIIAKEKLKCREHFQKEYAEKEKALAAKQEKEIAALKDEQEAELEKMKKLYAEQLEEAGKAFRDKAVALRKEIDQHKEQIEVLMLHIDDPFVIQEMQMKQRAQAEDNVSEEAEEQ